MASDSSFVRPTLAKLIRRVKSDISTRLPGADANLRGSPEAILGIGAGGMTHGTHGHLKWVSRQILPDISEAEFLIREANARAGMTQTAAVSATGSATITGVNTTVCPSGTLWTRGDGVVYSQSAAATITGGQATISLVAVITGTNGDAIVGTKLTIASGVTGINSEATVSGSGIVGGAEIEAVEALRIRYLEHLRTPPNGGGPGFYVAWAKKVTGVTRAWQVANLLGLGTVGVYFVRDNDVSMFPDAGEVTTVQTALDLAAPVTAESVAICPTNSPLAMTFSVLTPNTTAVRTAIEAELTALLYESANPDAIVTIELSRINEAISIATGETDHVLTVPVADVTAAVGVIRTLGPITWPV